MEIHQSVDVTGEDIGIPDDLRCKRSDGKQWRCTAMSMPDKTVRKKHYIQAKKRAANSALKANIKKPKGNSLGDGAEGVESQSDDMDLPVDTDVHGFPLSAAGIKHMERILQNQVLYSPESPPAMGTSGPNNLIISGDFQRETTNSEENWRSSRTPPPHGVESLRNISHISLDPSTVRTSGVDMVLLIVADCYFFHK